MGKNGGYFLIKKPSEINVGHIIRLIDGPIALLPCVSYKFYQPCEDCEDEATCGLHHVLAQLREAHNKILNKVSLSEMIKREIKLKGHE
jgi:Rrf2 family protein